jgi:D-sedoheptulose 7-phosphate isomerase
VNSIKNSVAYFEVLASTLRGLIPGSVDAIATELLQAYNSGRTIYLFGNGGSAATASHFACDLGKGTAKWIGAQRRFRVFALTDNAPVMTAWANDSSYDEVFAEQLRNCVRPGDVAFAISGSGNSSNVITALKAANSAGARTVGLAGFEGGRMKGLCRSCLVVPSNNMEVIEDLHMAVCHCLSTILREAITDMHRGTATAAEAMARFSVTVDGCSDFVTKPEMPAHSHPEPLDFTARP